MNGRDTDTGAQQPLLRYMGGGRGGDVGDLRRDAQQLRMLAGGLKLGWLPALWPHLLWSVCKALQRAFAARRCSRGSTPVMT